MPTNERQGAGDIHASIVRLRREAEWYRLRLQETYDRIAVLEQTAATEQHSGEADKSTSDGGHTH